MNTDLPKLVVIEGVDSVEGAAGKRLSFSQVNLRDRPA